MPSYDVQAATLQPQASSLNARILPPRPFDVTFSGQEKVAASPFPSHHHTAFMGNPVATVPSMSHSEPQPELETEAKPVEWLQFKLYADGQEPPAPPRWPRMQANLSAATIPPTIQRNSFLLGIMPQLNRRLNFLTVKEADEIAGHRWIEIDGTESYGWWPRYRPDQRTWGINDYAYQQGLVGVAGELNAVSSPRTRGTPTRDPHHGETVQDAYHPYLREADRSKTDSQIRQDVRNFARSFRGDYRMMYPGPNCRTFVNDLMGTVGLERPPLDMSHPRDFEA